MWIICDVNNQLQNKPIRETIDLKLEIKVDE
jgi:hypothetical protein